jgi:hypothetical protein
MGGIEEHFLEVLGQEEIFGAATCRVLFLEMVERRSYLYVQ